MAFHKTKRGHDGSKGDTGINAGAATTYDHWRSEKRQSALRYLVAKTFEQHMGSWRVRSKSDEQPRQRT